MHTVQVKEKTENLSRKNCIISEATFPGYRDQFQLSVQIREHRHPLKQKIASNFFHGQSQQVRKGA